MSTSLMFLNLPLISNANAYCIIHLLLPYMCQDHIERLSDLPILVPNMNGDIIGRLPNPAAQQVS